MRGFIGDIAECLYSKYGDEISSLNIIFPSRRAQLFFADEVSKLTERPIWQPNFLTINDLMGELTGMTPSDPIRLITELYKVYSRYHEESFDSFYFWGEMLLADYDSVDKYLINADRIFSNVAELKELESDLSYLTSEQREVISQFWNTLSLQKGLSMEQEKFLKIWSTLAPIYHEFKAKLYSDQMAYTGMIYREAVERIAEERAPKLTKDNYIVAGFSALSECEKRLFKHLQSEYEVEFFWDYDRYYLKNEAQEAGMFLRDNVSRFPQKRELAGGVDNFLSDKRITVVSAPSDSMQCRFVYDLLEELAEERREKNLPALDKETAVVLTDENLLLPLLHSIPESVDGVNITMGYPLRQTLAYSFVERLIGLQSGRKSNSKRDVFYHADVMGLLTHPYFAGENRDMVKELVDLIINKQLLYVDKEKLSVGGRVFAGVFAAPEGWEEMGEYILRVVSAIAGQPYDGEDRRLRLEYFTLITEHTQKLVNTLRECKLDLTERVFASLLRSTLQSLRIPYEGEPLRGVQIMGILETRNLDFENVIVLSMNDDTFPGNRAVSSSFIPFSLRIAYGLPTPQHHEGVFAYYFYRLLQRAKNITLVYSSRADEKHTGEPSRYIYQLKYELPFEIEQKYVSLDVNLVPSEAIVVQKIGNTGEELERFLDNGGRKLSPSSFFNYVECPLKFYFRLIADLRIADEVTEEVDSPMFGTILHKAMQLLYADLMGVERPCGRISKLIGTESVVRAVDGAINEVFLKGESLPEEQFGGNLLLVKDVITRYINGCLLPYDSALGDSFEQVVKLEKPIGSEIEILAGGTPRKVCFVGLADRIDRLNDGILRIVDYKTGNNNREFRSVDSLFSDNPLERNQAALQMMLYMMMAAQENENTDCQAALYVVRQMNKPDFSPLIFDRSTKTEVTHYSDYKESFETLLSEKLSELFDLERPFTQCKELKTCEWCDYRKICRR